jgi:PAS domain S-box-containing protein
VQALFTKWIQKRMRNFNWQNKNVFNHSLLDALDNISFIVTDLGGKKAKIKEFSKGAEKIFGYSKEEIVEKQVALLHLDKDINRFSQMLDDLKKEKKGFSGDVILIRKNREQFPAFFSLYPYFDSNNKLIGAIRISVDISAQKAAENRYEGLFSNMSNGVAIYKGVDNGNNFEFIDINLAGQRLSKVNKHEIIGKKVTTIFPGVEKIGLLDVFKKVYKTGIPQTHPLSKYEDKKLTEWVENYVYKLPTGEIVAIYEDTSKREIAMEALKRNEAEKIAILNGISTNITFLNKYLEIIWANKKVHEFYGKSGDIIGNKCHNIYNDNNYPCDNCPVKKAFQTKKTERTEIINKQGEIWKKIAEPVHTENGDLIGILEIAENITSKREIESTIKNLLQGTSYDTGLDFFKTMVSSLSQTIHADYTYIGELDSTKQKINTLAFCDQGKITDNFSYELKHTPCIDNLNQKIFSIKENIIELYPKADLLIQKKIEGFTGVPLFDKEGEVLGILVCMFKKPIENLEFIESILQIFASRAAAEIDRMYKDKGLKERELELNNIKDNLENLVDKRTQELEQKTKGIEESRKALTYLLEDVNESRLELKDVNNQLESVNKELEAFAYSVSHDLRAPLRHIDGFINLLVKPENYADSDKFIKYSEIISKSAKKMGILIDDLLMFSRIGRNAIRRSPFELKELINEILEENKTSTEGRKLKFKIGKLPNLNADRNLMNIVFTNLISNAIKFTKNKDQAIIEIGCEIDESNQNTIYIKDNGAGFNMKYAEKLFGVFQRLHTENEFEGTGIGLANVQRIVHKHGGTVWAKSEVDKGATFYLKL